MRCISEACIKRFSKIVSVITERPSACVISAMYCACISVGKRGCGSVVTSRAFKPLGQQRTCSVLWLTSSISTPASRSLLMTTRNVPGGSL